MTEVDHPELRGADPAALDQGRVTNARIRPAPLIPSWVLKVVMAVTGSIFVLFVIAHMVGNLKIYDSAAGYNDYAHWLRVAFKPILPHGGLLLIMRIALAASLIGHVTAALILRRRARQSSGKTSKPRAFMHAYTPQNMLFTGLILLGFVIFHILDLTAGQVVATDDFQHPTAETSFAYENVIASFQRPVVAAIYSLTLIALALHVTRGIRAVVSDLGGTGKRLQRTATIVAGAAAIAVLVGNISIPIAVQLGWLT